MEQQWPWTMPIRVEDIPEGGLERHLSADETTRERVAVFADLRTLRRFEADFVITRRGNGLKVVGEVTATVGQTCVITLDLVENEVVETVDLIFEPPRDNQPEEVLPLDVTADSPEPLYNGTIDLGAIATEFLVLGIDPYPRKPGVAFEEPKAQGATISPFARLAERKSDPGEGD